MRPALAGIVSITILSSLMPEPVGAQAPSWGPQSYDETVRRATNLAREQPRTTWEQVVTADAADLIEFIGTDRILVGFVDISRLGEPNHDKVTLLDARDGTTLWTADRLPYQRGGYTLVATAPHILLLGSDAATYTLTALDTATGRNVWSVGGRAPVQLALATPERILVLRGEGTRSRLEALVTATGRSEWRIDLDEQVAGDSTRPRLLVSGDTALVVGRSVAEVAIQSGTMVRSIAPRAAGSDEPNARLVPGGGGCCSGPIGRSSCWTAPAARRAGRWSIRAPRRVSWLSKPAT